MKNLLNITTLLKVSALAVLILLSSCDEFLTTPPVDRLSVESFYTTPDAAIMAVNAIYSTLSGDYPMKHIADFGSQLENGDDLFGYVSGDIYSRSYQGIYTANLAIANIPDIDFGGRDDVKNTLMAEARTLRAWFYYQLSLYLGPVIMITESSKYEDMFSYERPRDIEVTRSFIRNELIASIPYLPPRKETVNGRVSVDFARFVLAEEYMLEKKWVEAEKYLMDIMKTQDYGLLPDFWDIASYDTKLAKCDAYEFNNESIFEVSFIEGLDGYSHGWFDQLTPGACSGKAYRIERQKLDESFFRRTFLNEYRVDTFVTTKKETWVDRQYGDWIEVDSGTEAHKPYYGEDPRRIPTIITYGDELICVETPEVYSIMDKTNTSKNGPDFLLRKYWPTSAVSFAGLRGRNFILMRYAQVILDYAEVQFHLGNEGPAYDYLNMVRGRAWAGFPEAEWKRSATSDLYPTSDWSIYVKAPLLAKGYDKFMVDLIHEYILEFCTEGISTPMMMRWGNRPDMALYVLDEDPNDVYPDQIYYGWPESEIAENPNIWQNPGF